MIDTSLKTAINQALDNLCTLNTDLFDYWAHLLYDSSEFMIESNWNVETLRLMENDVMGQIQA